jgi:DNA-binding protein H-NS
MMATAAVNTSNNPGNSAVANALKSVQNSVSKLIHPTTPQQGEKAKQMNTATQAPAAVEKKDVAQPAAKPAAPAMSELDKLLAEKAKRDAEAAELEAKIKALKDAERSKIVGELHAKIATFELTAEDLFPGITARIRAEFSHQNYEAAPRRGRPRADAGDGTRTRTPAPVKFKDKNGNQWSGRGLKPRWISAALAAGAKLEDFAV